MLSALVVLLGSLTVYDFALRAEYFSCSYKNPFAGYARKNIKDFNEIEVDATNMIRVSIKQGNYSIRVSLTNTDSVKFEKVGNRLIVSVDFKKNPKLADADKVHINNIYIFCPKLSTVITDEQHLLMTNKAKIENEERGTRLVVIENFKLDSLNTRQNNGNLNIYSSKIASLKSVTAGNSALCINEDCFVGKADMNITDHSSLILPKFNIPQFTYAIADSATINFTSKGAFLKELVK
jgi:hypothetical protein